MEFAVFEQELQYGMQLWLYVSIWNVHTHLTILLENASLTYLLAQVLLV